MTEAQVPQALCDWAAEVLPELEATYPEGVTAKGSLPDLVAELNSTDVEVGVTEFPLSSIQQAMVLVRRLTLSFMVDNTVETTADAQLKDFATRLMTSALLDGTLGGRVPFISRLMTFNYDNPFVEYPDGTRGREMTLNLSVGELVEQA
jgi:hypothetical protein